MAVVPGVIPIGETGESLDSVLVDTPAGAGLHRETVVLADPENPAGLARVKTLETPLDVLDYGVVTHSVIQGWSTAQGGGYHDVKVTPSGALTVEAVVTGAVSVQGAVSIAEPVTVEGAVSVDGPVTVTGTVAVDQPVTVEGTVSVDNLPVEYPLPSAQLDALIAASSGGAVGVWGYKAGVSGEPTIPAGAKITQISASASTNQVATFSINGGDDVPIPLGQAVTFEPKGALVSPTIVFVNTASFIIEYTI